MAQREHLDWTAEQRQRIEQLIDEYRTALHDSLNDLTEEEAQRPLVPSKTTLLGLVKHAGFVEGVWFDQAITGRSLAEIDIARTVDASFDLDEDDTIATVQAAYRSRWETSRSNLSGLSSDDVVDGRGARPVWALRLQVLRELAQHAGHADILREQVLASRWPPSKLPRSHTWVPMRSVRPGTPRRHRHWPKGATTTRSHGRRHDARWER